MGILIAEGRQSEITTRHLSIYTCLPLSAWIHRESKHGGTITKYWSILKIIC